MREIPREHTVDAVIPILLSDGYRYISRRCDEFGTDIFETRLLLRRALCIRGEEAARIFYDPELFRRKGAVPRRILKTLLGRGGVHGLDEDIHLDRKEMFMQLMRPQDLERMREILTAEWERAISTWEKSPKISLFPEAKELLCRAICQWAGVPLREEEVRRRTEDLAAMVDAFGAMGLRHWRGRRARIRTEKWIRRMVRQIRQGKLTPHEGTAADVISFHRDLNGKLLRPQIAAVELINVLRPTIAVAYPITFAALALHELPQYRQQLQSGSEEMIENFVQEVRRFYPFAPFMGAISRKEFQWQGYRIPKGRLVILDLYGTNHDRRVWERPGEFFPERFRSWNHSPFNFIPNGGGDFFLGHRCAGEWLTIELMRSAVTYLARAIDYKVPNQDLGFSMTRMPTYPRSEFVMKEVRRIQAERGAAGPEAA